MSVESQSTSDGCHPTNSSEERHAFLSEAKSRAYADLKTLLASHRDSKLGSPEQEPMPDGPKEVHRVLGLAHRQVRRERVLSGDGTEALSSESDGNVDSENAGDIANVDGDGRRDADAEGDLRENDNHNATGCAAQHGSEVLQFEENKQGNNNHKDSSNNTSNSNTDNESESCTAEQEAKAAEESEIIIKKANEIDVKSATGEVPSDVGAKPQDSGDCSSVSTDDGVPQVGPPPSPRQDVEHIGQVPPIDESSSRPQSMPEGAVLEASMGTDGNDCSSNSNNDSNSNNNSNSNKQKQHTLPPPPPPAAAASAVATYRQADWPALCTT